MIPEYRTQHPRTLVAEDVEREIRRRAVLSVCRLARDANDASQLLETLGLRAVEGHVDRQR